MENCVFCKIIRGDIPSMRVYEDDACLVIMDIAADVDGHMLAIPKRHVHDILDCDSETLTSLIKAVQRVSRHCVEERGYEGVNLLHASGEAAGQSVGHFHVHLIPRKTADGIDAWPHFTGARHPIEELYQHIKMEEP